MPLSREEQSLVDDELAETRLRLESWVHRQLENPVEMGKGRNNQMVALTPRMVELGFDEEAIFEKFKEMYGLEDDESKDQEIWKAIANGQKYKSPLVIRDSEDDKRTRVQRAKVRAAASAALKKVMTDYQWTEQEIIDAGGCADLAPKDQRSQFLKTMFDADEIVWCGAVYHSGKPKHVANFRRAGAWWMANPVPSFEFVSHCTFRPGCYSRCIETVAERKYLVVESDELQRDEIGAVFNWLVAGGLQLRAVVYSGGKSLHGWFNWPENFDEMAANLAGLRCDPSTMRPSQPVRLPGVIRKDTQKLQRLLYLSA